MAAFREALEDCELIDLGFSGQWYTWERGRFVSNNIRERLDRGVANPERWDPFLGFTVGKLWGDNGTRDEFKWLGKKGQKLRERRTEKFNARLFELGAREINLDLNLEADKEEIFWEQRVKTNWLRMRDKNTVFFHKCASYRKKKNMVKGLEDETGNLITDNEEMSKMAAAFFKDLFSSKELVIVIDCRQITDNIFVAYEIIHSFKKRRWASKNGFVLKLDMSKAYDRIEWSFLEKNMCWLGFCEGCISFIMRCINSVTYTIVLNGRNGEEFRPQRGLRQGDPPSPYLFLICAEGFSLLIAMARREGRLVGTKVGRGNVLVSHLFFVDDRVLFGEASIEGANKKKNVIKDYEKVSGQLVNIDKLMIYFSKNVNSETQEQAGGILGVRISNNPEKYLGLSTMGARQILEEGIGWRVGNAASKDFPIGSQYNVRNGNWWNVKVSKSALTSIATKKTGSDLRYGGCCADVAPYAQTWRRAHVRTEAAQTSGWGCGARDSQNF
ncbi:reverse transcriptase [Gossypium australe]|uniref:Reverse transcriptase n=1 Tax=Gossypium australe TaxID=47621 RepID=A0A5B6VQK3_9ROSI|nr:reverse transcriptase [Gossypium australe]